MDLSERRQVPDTRHPWETARADAIEQLIRGLPLVRPRVLDVGAGDAYLLAQLGRRLDFAAAVAQDIHFSDAHLAELEAPGVELVRELGSLHDRRFDLVLLLDVLEHIEQPERLLDELCSTRLERGACVVVTVPAFQLLFSEHDRALQHVRRYSRPQICDLLQEAGLFVHESGYLFSSLLLPRALTTLRQHLLATRPSQVQGIGEWRAPAFLTRGLHSALALDNRLCLWAQRRGVTLPGLSAWAVCNLP